MWPRIAEIVLALWLMAAPSFLGGPAWGGHAARALALVVLAASAASFAARFRRAHLASLASSLALCALPYFHPNPAPPLLQAAMITGLVIAMCAVIPVGATKPPPGWEAFDEAMEGQEPFEPPRAPR